jgi:hypothetical protein
VAKSRRRAPARRGPSKPRTPTAAPPAPSRRRQYLLQALAVAVVAVLTYVLVLRTRGPGELSAEALAAADAAGCSALERPVEPDPARTHLGPGQSFDYPDPPAAAGPHDPTPLPDEPHVYEEPVPETETVHSLEHAFVLVYHDGLSAETVDALEAFARDADRVIVAPYLALPEGSGLALLAWNTRLLCPTGVTPQQAVAIAEGFADAFAGTTVAPEPPRGLFG